jgi:hypothetical protein
MRAEGFVHPKPCAVAQARGPQGDGGDALAFRQSPKFRVLSHGRTDVTIWTRRKSRVQPGEVIDVNFK